MRKALVNRNRSKAYRFTKKFALLVITSVTLWQSRLAAEISTDVKSLLEKKLSAFADEIATQVKKEHVRDLIDFSPVLIRPGLAVRNGRPSAAYWLFFRIEFRHSGTGGGAGAEGTVVLEILPNVINGKLTVQGKSWILDMRYKDWGFGAMLNGEEKVQNVITRLLPLKLDNMADNAANAFAALLPQKIPPSALDVLNASWWSPRQIATHLFPVDTRGVLLDDKVAHFAGLEAGDYEHAALVVIFSSHNEANIAAWRRENDMNSDQLRRERSGENHGWIFRINYLKPGESQVNLKNVHDSRGDWNDRIGSLVILPGPKFTRECFAIFKDENFTGDTITLSPGIYSLRIKANGVYPSLWNSTTAYRVTK